MMKLRFKKGDRVILSDNCNEDWIHQNKNRHGDVFGGTILSVVLPKLDDSQFDYRVEWDRGATSTICWYRDKDLAPERRYESNKNAASLLSKEW
jgi:hypothetical protein